MVERAPYIWPLVKPFNPETLNMSPSKKNQAKSQSQTKWQQPDIIFIPIPLKWVPIWQPLLISLFWGMVFALRMGIGLNNGLIGLGLKVLICIMVGHERHIVKFWGTYSFKKPTNRICCSTTFTRSISEVWNKAENSEHWFRLDKCDHSRWWTHTLYFETGQSRKHFILLLLFISKVYLRFLFYRENPIWAHGGNLKKILIQQFNKSKMQVKLKSEKYNACDWTVNF